MTFRVFAYYTDERPTRLTMPVSYEHKEALQHLVTDYYAIWIRSSQEELPDWFYRVLDFMEVECLLRFSVVPGRWEEA